MIHCRIRAIGLVLIAVICAMISLTAPDVPRILAGVAGCALTALGFLALTRKKRMPIWAEAVALYSSALVLLGLMLLDERPLLPGILYFVLIPATARMPRPQRISAWLATVAAIASVYLVRRLYLSIDPIVPICQLACIVCVAAFTEASRRQYEAMEESRRLLEGLIAAQRRAAETEAAGRGAAIRKAVGGLLARAALQVEGARELWPVDQNRAAQLSYKAQETMRAALDCLRVAPTPGEEGEPGVPARAILAHSSGEMAESLSILVASGSDIEIATTVGDAESLAGACERERHDLVLVDEDLPPGGWAEALARVLSSRPEARCLVLSSLPDPELETRARERGAVGLVDCGAPPGEIMATLRAKGLGPRRAPVAFAAVPGAGKPEFSARELQILGLIAKGFSNKEISERLFLAEGTVKNRVTSILQKIGARDRGNAALRARDLGLI